MSTPVKLHSFFTTDSVEEDTELNCWIHADKKFIKMFFHMRFLEHKLSHKIKCTTA